MSDIDFKFSHRAFAKMMMHIIKHLKSDCYGVLVGKIIHSQNKNNHSNEQVETVEIIDTYAFSHDKVFVPQLDLFLKMIEYKLIGSEYYVVGFYENLMLNFDKSEVKPSPCSFFMCEGLSNSKRVKRPYLLEITHGLDQESDDGKRMKGKADYIIYRYLNNNNFEHCLSYKDDEFFDLMRELLSNHHQLKIQDFDDHLMDSKVDYTNVIIDNLVESALDKIHKK